MPCRGSKAPVPERRAGGGTGPSRDGAAKSGAFQIRSWVPADEAPPIFEQLCIYYGVDTGCRGGPVTLYTLGMVTISLKMAPDEERTVRGIPSSCTIVATDVVSGDVAGFAAVSLDWFDHGRGEWTTVPEEGTVPSDCAERPHLRMIAVRRRFRGRGVGRSLLAACDDVVGRWGKSELVLEVRPRNRPALALYEAVGYRKEHDDMNCNTVVTCWGACIVPRPEREQRMTKALA